MKELLLKLSFSQFLKTPFSWLFIAVLCALVYLGKTLLADKDEDINSYKVLMQECDEERKKDKQLLQDIVFQQHIKKKIDE